MDTKKIKHYERLDEFIRGRLLTDLYPEPPSEPGLSITRKMIDEIDQISPLQGKRVLDCGCGQGAALEAFALKGATATGITFGEDYLVCREKSLDVYEMDQSFLDFPEDHFDLVWCRHALEHSLFPLFTLHGFKAVLKSGGFVYVEVPAPSTSAMHERNKNHYSCFTGRVWLSTFEKIGLKLIQSFDINVTVPCGPDLYHAYVLQK